MKPAEIRNKVAQIKKLLTEYDTICALVRAMKKCQKDGLDINGEYLYNVEKRITVIETKFDEIFK